MRCYACLQHAVYGICFERNAVCCSYTMDLEEKRDAVNYSDFKTLPLSEQGTLCVTGPNQVRIPLFFVLSYLVLEDLCC